MTFAFFGEMMLRLSPPGRELLLQTPKLDVAIAGAEANVATGLASGQKGWRWSHFMSSTGPK